jgi:hypothetical protein
MVSTSNELFHFLFFFFYNKILIFSQIFDFFNFIYEEKIKKILKILIFK